MNRILLLAVMLMSYSLSASATLWEKVKVPSNGVSNSIGSYSNGCLAGGETLPLEGEGYQVIRSQRGRYYGHSEMIQFLTELSSDAQKLRLGNMLVGDISMPRGGRFSSGHASHQTGLDADIWLKITDAPLEKESLVEVQPLPMVHIKDYKINNKNWSNKQALLIQLAAIDDRVARIFVHPVIKEQLCKSEWQNRDWLRKVRPWWGHYYHFHVRLSCPDGSTNCKAQNPPPPGDGCGAELASWKPQKQVKQTAQNKKKETKPKKKKPVKIPPPQCLALIQ